MFKGLFGKGQKGKFSEVIRPKLSVAQGELQYFNEQSQNRYYQIRKEQFESKNTKYLYQVLMNEQLCYNNIQLTEMLLQYVEIMKTQIQGFDQKQLPEHLFNVVSQLIMIRQHIQSNTLRQIVKMIQDQYKSIKFDAQMDPLLMQVTRDEVQLHDEIMERATQVTQPSDIDAQTQVNIDSYIQGLDRQYLQQQ